MTIEQLNEQFGITGTAQFVNGNENLPVLQISNKNATAEISIYAAHILSYKPANQQDILWMSSKSIFEKGKAIRGGIPLCFPWFGPHPTDTSKPQHGFARLQDWTVSKIKILDEGNTLVSLTLTENDYTLKLWPYQFKACLDISIGKSLEVCLTVTNTGATSFEYSDALHTYFNIGNIEAIEIEGLQNTQFYEGFTMDLKGSENANLKFENETNRRYINHLSDCIIHDPILQRKIRVAKTGSKLSIVWNPAEAVTKTIVDMEPNGYKTFVCIEPANAYPGIDMIHLKEGESHTLSTLIEII